MNSETLTAWENIVGLVGRLLARVIVIVTDQQHAGDNGGANVAVVMGMVCMLCDERVGYAAR